MPQPPDRLHGAHVALGSKTRLKGPLADVQSGGHISHADRSMAVAQDPVLRIAAVLLRTWQATSRPGVDPIPGLQLLDQAVGEALQGRSGACNCLNQLPGQPQQVDHGTGALP